METRIQSSAASAWAIVCAAIVLLAVTAGSRSVFGLFVSPLNSATGLGIATISFAVAVSQLTWGAAQPLCGLAAERWGAPRVITAGSLLGAGCAALLPLVDSATSLVALLAVSGVAATVGSPSLLVGTASQHFAPERRGLIAGVVGAGGPLGQLLLAPATQAIISAAGWAAATLSLAAMALVAVPLALVFRSGAQMTSVAAHGAAHPAATLQDALRSRDFWLINAVFFVCGLHVFFLVTHLPGVIELCGLPASVSAVALAVLGLFNIAGSIGAGVVTQRYSMTGTLAVLFAARALGIGLFLIAPKTELVVLTFSIWMGLTYMAVLPPTAGLIGRLFGAQRLATLLGVTFMLHQVGAFLGTWLGGLVLEATASYDRMWMLDMALAVLAAAVSLTIREQPAPPRSARRATALAAA